MTRRANDEASTWHVPYAGQRRAPGHGVRIGVPTEIKPAEDRVALTPAAARELTSRGHEVFAQAEAGEGASLPDEVFVAADAKIVEEAGEGADRLRELERSSGGRIRTLMLSCLLLEQQVAVCDPVVGAVLLPGGHPR